MKEEENGFLMARALTGLQVSDAVRVSGDLFGYLYDEAINGVDGSVLGNVSLTYDFSPSTRLVGTASASPRCTVSHDAPSTIGPASALPTVTQSDEKRSTVLARVVGRRVGV